MVGITQDDRTDEQKQTHVWAVVGTDPFMSGWGEATGGMSYAAWAYQEGHQSAVEGFVRARGDMHRIRIVYLPDWRPRAAHTHVYVYDRPGRF